MRWTPSATSSTVGSVQSEDAGTSPILVYPVEQVASYGRRAMMAVMKVRFGIGMPNVRPQDDVPALLDLFEGSGIDSLWFSEVVHAPQLDPVVGMAYSLAHTQRL